MSEFHRLEILKSLKESFKDVIPVVYYTDRKSSTTTQQDTFLVIKNGDMEDFGAYGDSYINLMIFQKDIDGLENTSQIDFFQKAIVSKLPINNDLFYTGYPHLLGCKSDGSGFHYLTIYFNIIIK